MTEKKWPLATRDYPIPTNDDPGAFGVQRWKYIHYFEDPEEFELFDLQSDPQEMNNLVNDPEYKDIIEQLKTRMTDLRKELKDPDL